MANEPDDPIAHQPVEEVGAHFVVVPEISRTLAHVVKECRGPELGIGRSAAGVIEDLQGVEEGVALRMILR